jgi:hypothetical protein
MMGSRAAAPATGTPRVKRIGSSSSSSAEKELEWPLWGVALRKRRLSNLGASARIARGGVAVDGVFGGGGGGGDVGLVEDEQALLGAVAEVVEERASVLGAADQRIADDEAVMGGPGVDAEAALAPAKADKMRLMTSKSEAEAAHHLALPLEADGGRADDQDKTSLLAEDQLLEDEAGLDGLAEADVVGDEEVGAG